MTEENFDTSRNASEAVQSICKRAQTIQFEPTHILLPVRQRTADFVKTLYCYTKKAILGAQLSPKRVLAQKSIVNIMFISAAWSLSVHLFHFKNSRWPYAITCDFKTYTLRLLNCFKLKFENRLYCSSGICVLYIFLCHEINMQ